MKKPKQYIKSDKSYEQSYQNDIIDLSLVGVFINFNRI